MSLFVEEGRRVGEAALINKMLRSRMNSQASMNREARQILINESTLCGEIRQADEAAAVTETDKLYDDVMIVAI
jgi:hypothetical protein